ncbi:MAG: glyceraldehyde 3-phosphate dehydrogenase NAD-binding domain-containing protein [Myxococcota bacterium]
MRVLGINGLGRIGKLTLWRHISLGYYDKIVINTGRKVGKNIQDIANYLESDSTYGQFSRYLYGFKGDKKRPVVKIDPEQENSLNIEGTKVVLLTRHRNPKDIQWHQHNVKIVVDTTGVFRDPTKDPGAPGGSIRGHLEGGARKVINSSAFKMKTNKTTPEDSVTLIHGINHHAFDSHEHNIVSAASCTTTALAHMIKPLLEARETSKLLTASMSTIHSTTNTQSVLDKVPAAEASDFRKNRMVLDNIILTSTNAAKALGIVVPQIQKIGFMADSVRIPTSTVSLVTLNITVQTKIHEDGESSVTREIVNNIMKKAAEGPQKDLLVYSEVQKVSTDYKGVDAAVIIEANDTHTRTAFLELDPTEVGLEIDSGKKLKIPVTHVKIFGWYDNEFGSYTHRLADLTTFIEDQLH